MLDNIFNIIGLILTSCVAFFVTLFVGKYIGEQNEKLNQEVKASNAKTTAVKLRNSADIDKLYDKYHTK